MRRVWLVLLFPITVDDGIDVTFQKLFATHHKSARDPPVWETLPYALWNEASILIVAYKEYITSPRIWFVPFSSDKLEERTKQAVGIVLSMC
jgi:hypothetical protein